MVANIQAQTHRADRFLDILRCPRSGERLTLNGNKLISASGDLRYRINNAEIPLFAENFLSSEADAQRRHYDRIAAAYTANLEYPHTQEYLAYLNRVTLDAIGDGELGTVAELCCGRGEALTLFGPRINRYVGLDVSENMLRAAVKLHDRVDAIFVQGDAIHLPLAPDSVDTVVTLGGMHHIPARAKLFSEIARVLKPGGRFLYREPVSDFFLWRALRSVIYRFSPMLNDGTERPLLYEETIPLLERAGLHSLRYRTHGLIGFCLFMNSDVLIFNRLFRFIPGIRSITRASARMDESLLARRALRRAGLQVIGVAQKSPRFRISNLGSLVR